MAASRPARSGPVTAGDGADPLADVDGPFAAALTPDVRAALAPIVLHRTFEPGETVVAEGAAADGMYLVVAGRAAARVTTVDGDELMLAIHGRGDIFGELALVRSNGLRTASVVALEPLTTVLITPTEFDRLRARDPNVERFLVAVLAERIARLTHQLQAALYLSVEERVVATLRRLAEVYGDGEPLVVPLAQTDIASMAGVSRQRCNQVIRGLVQRGAIRVAHRRIVITDRAAFTSGG